MYQTKYYVNLMICGGVVWRVVFERGSLVEAGICREVVIDPAERVIRVAGEVSEAHWNRLKEQLREWIEGGEMFSRGFASH